VEEIREYLRAGERDGGRDSQTDGQTVIPADAASGFNDRDVGREENQAGSMKSKKSLRAGGLDAFISPNGAHYRAPRWGFGSL
jgi:hypothetical protein